MLGGRQVLDVSDIEDFQETFNKDDVDENAAQTQAFVEKMRGKSFAFEAPAGTGKTFIGKAIVEDDWTEHKRMQNTTFDSDEEEQKARGERYLFVAPTNQAKNLLDDKAMTFDHLQGRLRDPRRLTRWAKSLRVVYADEVSMMQAEHWEVLNVLKR